MAHWVLNKGSEIGEANAVTSTPMGDFLAKLAPGTFTLYGQEKATVWAEKLTDENGHWIDAPDGWEANATKFN